MHGGSNSQTTCLSSRDEQISDAQQIGKHCMTIIAWDGFSLAGDRQRTFGGTPSRTRKVHRVAAPNGHEFLVGCAGRSDYIEAFMAWMRTGEQKPDMDRDAEFHALVIDRRKRIFAIRGTLVYIRVQSRCWAIGSGCDLESACAQ